MGGGGSGSGSGSDTGSGWRWWSVVGPGSYWRWWWDELGEVLVVLGGGCGGKRYKRDEKVMRWCCGGGCIGGNTCG